MITKYEQEVHSTVRRLWLNRYKPDLHSFVANCRFKGRVFVECIADGIKIDEHTTDNAVERTIFAESRNFLYEVTNKLVELNIDLKTIEI